MLYAIIAVAALILDQAVKYWTSAHIVLNSGTRELIPGFIHLANVHNEGAAFSFMEGARWFFVVLCVVFVAAVIVLLAKNVINTPVARWMSIFVLAGAVGNCIDRIIAGYVVDMFEFSFKIFGSAFPVFNVADIFIVVGGIGFCLCVLLEKEPAKASPAPARESYAAPCPVKKAESAPAPTKSARRTAPAYPAAPKPAPEDEDPFAQWERIASAPVAGRARDTQSGAAPAASQPSAAQRPAAARPSAAPTQRPSAPAAVTSRPASPTQRPASPVSPSRSAAAQPEYTGRHAAPEAAPAQKSASPARPEAPRKAEPAKPAPRSDEPSYDLEDILAEFRDL